MSGTNRLIVSTLGKGSVSAMNSALENANEVAAKEEKEKKPKDKKEKK